LEIDFYAIGKSDSHPVAGNLHLTGEDSHNGSFSKWKKCFASAQLTIRHRPSSYPSRDGRPTDGLAVLE
jgi:hypothetical protein